MKTILLALALAILAIVSCEPPASKRPLVFSNWPPQSAKQHNGHGHSVVRNGQRTLVVQIRSDSRIPFVLKRAPTQHTHQPIMARPLPPRPQKVPQHVHVVPKPVPIVAKPLRKPNSVLKIKLPSVKPQPQLQQQLQPQQLPVHYQKPYIYEKPMPVFHDTNSFEMQKLPIDTSVQFINQHYAPIHTIPAPNLGIHDNHIYHEDTPTFAITSFDTPSFALTGFGNHQYQVTEDGTNDHTIVDPFSGRHKLFAPDPDPSLPTTQIRPAVEHFNTPSNGKPLPADVQSNYLPPVAPPQKTYLPVPAPQKNYLPPAAPQKNYLPPMNSQSPPISIHQLPVTFSGPLDSQPQLQQYFSQQAATTAPRAPLSLYNPTYLVSQSNNLLKQHQQQLFKPNSNFLESLSTGYANADLTQEIASNGQILQSAKDHGVHPEYTSSGEVTGPTFAALVAAAPSGPEFASLEDFSSNGGGFVVSNHYGQNPLAYNPSQHQSFDEAALEEANLELQRQIFQHTTTPVVAEQPAGPPANSAYEEHQRLLEKHLGPSPLRIFVPDEDYTHTGRAVITKRSDNYKEGTVEDDNSKEGAFSVSSSVEVSSSNDSK